MGAVLNLLKKEQLQHNWLSSMWPQHSARVKRVTDQRAEIVGTNVLPIQIRESRIRFIFQIVRYIAFFALLSAKLIYKFSKSIPAQRKIVSFNSPVVPILSVQEVGTEKKGDQHTENNNSWTAEQIQEQELVGLTVTVLLKPLS